MAEALHLVRLTAANKVFDKLKSTWDRQIDKLDIPRDGYNSAMDYAAKIIAEEPISGVYGIYALCGGDPGSPAAPYEAFVHLNHKLPKTSAAEVRVVWNRFAPRYVGEANRSKIAEIYTDIIHGGLNLAAKNVKCNRMRMYLPNEADLRFAEVFAPVFTKGNVDRWSSTVRGQWLFFERGHPK